MANNTLSFGLNTIHGDAPLVHLTTAADFVSRVVESTASAVSNGVSSIPSWPSAAAVTASRVGKRLLENMDPLVETVDHLSKKARIEYDHATSMITVLAGSISESIPAEVKTFVADTVIPTLNHARVAVNDHAQSPVLQGAVAAAVFTVVVMASLCRGKRAVDIPQEPLPALAGPTTNDAMMETTDLVQNMPVAIVQARPSPPVEEACDAFPPVQDRIIPAFPAESSQDTHDDAEDDEVDDEVRPVGNLADLAEAADAREPIKTPVWCHEDTEDEEDSEEEEEESQAEDDEEEFQDDDKDEEASEDDIEEKESQHSDDDDCEGAKDDKEDDAMSIVTEPAKSGLKDHDDGPAPTQAIPCFSQTSDSGFEDTGVRSIRPKPDAVLVSEVEVLPRPSGGRKQRSESISVKGTIQKDQVNATTTAPVVSPTPARGFQTPRSQNKPRNAVVPKQTGEPELIDLTEEEDEDKRT